MSFKNIFIVVFAIFLMQFACFGITISPKVGKEGVAPSEADRSITAIEVSGNNIITEQEVLESVFSKIGDMFIREKIDNDLKAVYSTGYFQDISVSVEAFAGGLKVIFNIVENPKVSKIVVEGNSVIPTSKILEIMKTKEGKILNFKTLQEDIQEVNDHYRDKGYILARVVDVTTDPVMHELKLKVIEGLIESIQIEGNDVTKDYVIYREMNIKPGDVMNEKLLSEDLRSIYNLGFFSEVSPNFEPGSARDKIVLVINVKESRTSTINFGGGYGEREGWFAFTDLNINNLFGTGHGAMIRGQIGEFREGVQRNNYQFKYYYPWFMPDVLGPRTSMTYRLWNTTGPDIYGEQISDALRIGWDFKFSRPFRENLSHSVIFGSESVSPITSATGEVTTFEAYVSDFIGYSLSYDTRDFWLNPTKGKFYTISIKKGWKKTGIITTYTKLGLDLNEYLGLASNQVIALHLGTGIGFGDVPIGELYWSGGANSVRGYFPTEAHTGVKKLIMNVEYRYSFNEVFQGVIFYDLGDAWGTVDAPGGGPNFSTFMSGRGFGMRLNTPLGPIRLDYGIGDSRAFGEGVIHFSIGQAF